MGHNFMYLSGGEYDLPRTDALYWVRVGRASLVEPMTQDPIVQEVEKKKARPVKRTVKR